MVAWKSLAAVVLLLAFATIASAQPHEALKPLFINLPGWEAEDAESMAVDAGGAKMVTATRTYTKGDSEVTAALLVGNQAMTQGKMEEMKAESGDGKLSVSEMDGFQVQVAYDKNEKSGAIVVLLSHGEKGGAMLTISFDGMDDKEAMGVVRQFDWKKMQAETAKLF